MWPLTDSMPACLFIKGFIVPTLTGTREHERAGWWAVMMRCGLVLPE